MPTSFADRLTTMEKIVALIAAGGLTFTTFKANTIANQISLQNQAIAIQKDEIEKISRTQEIEIASRKESREEVKEVNELTHKIYEEFVEGLKEKSSNPEIFLDRMTGVLVLTDAIQNPGLRSRMSEAVQQAIGRIPADGKSSSDRLEGLKFDAEEVSVRAEAQQKAEIDSPTKPVTKHTAAAATSTSKWGNYDFDIFWCDGVPESVSYQTFASKVAGLKAGDPTASGRWRLRPLPSAVNQRSGYGIKGVQIRVSSEDERLIARELKTLMENKLGSTPVTIKNTVQKTPWYVSVFACGQ